MIPTGKKNGEISPAAELPQNVKKASQSLRPQAQTVEIIFSGGVYVGENTARLANVRRVYTLRALPRAAAFSNESPVKRVSFESLSKILF